MTALKARDIPGFLKKRPKEKVLILLYGPDQGLIRERANLLGHQVVEDLNDPFNAIELTETDLSDVGRLTDETAALSFMGGERLIRVRAQGEGTTRAVKFFLERM